MAITPQAIKDQEFQVKFRGYDTVEVKAYLELIAEEFFELLEQVRQQVDELDIIVEERDTLISEKKSLEDELTVSRGSSEEIENVFAERDNELEKMKSEIDGLRHTISSLEQNLQEKEKDLEEARRQRNVKESDLDEEKQRVVKLMDKIEGLEKQNEELRSEELDFKSTLVAAQQFSNEMRRKSETEARAIVDNAKREAEDLRQETQNELASYPAEIERLKKRSEQVRGELERVLKQCLDSLDMFGEYPEEDYGELYQKVVLDDNADLNESLSSIESKLNLNGEDSEIPSDLFSLVDKESDDM